MATPIASASLATSMTESTGPKISPCAIVIALSTPVKIVGSK
ncbi:MAG TPA: hypothetical protein VH231_06840 [Solirubrobacteraceae bacterium]|nr:hypothetical protein [Solirubrobacteraceae bacterium]